MNDTVMNVDHRPVMTLLGRCPAYKSTSMGEAEDLASSAGIEKLWVKNEAERMGLGSFKALGGSYAILQMLAASAGMSDNDIDIDDPVFKQAASEITFVCATAGNHGLSVAAAASVFGARAEVYLADSVPESFAERLRAKGATVVRRGAVYADSLDGALAASEQPGYQLIADTSWPGYIEIPRLIYQGYTALAEECRNDFTEMAQWPSHVFLQAGVRGMAAAVAAHIRQWWPQQPEIIIVEPDAAPCLGRSIAAGKMLEVDGPVSNMGRLDCKEPSLLTFESLKHTADRFIEITDAEADGSTELLASAGFPSTPSGTAGFAALLKLRAQNALPDNARCLVIVSEGSE